MTEADFEAICRRWKQGLEDVAKTIDKAHNDGQYSWMERAATLGVASSLGFMVSGDYLGMSPEDRKGFLTYLDEAELRKP